MLEKIPNQEVLTEMLGHDLFEVWQKLRAAIEEKYIIEGLWNTGGKKWDYEYKYRKGSKPFAVCMQEKIVLVLWLFWAKTKEINLKA